MNLNRTRRVNIKRLNTSARLLGLNAGTFVKFGGNYSSSTKPLIMIKYLQAVKEISKPDNTFICLKQQLTRYERDIPVKIYKNGGKTADDI